MRFSSVCGLLALSIPFVAAAGEHSPHWSRRHQQVAKRARGDVGLHKRQTYSNARFTFYDVGLGACGQWNTRSDFIVALNVEQYGNGYPGPHCFESITISYGGKTAQATIMDECMGCPWGGLDFSRGLFDFFADESLGVLYGSWWFNDGSGGGSTPTTSTTPQWTPTSTTPEWTPPATSTTPEWTPTTTYAPPPTTSTPKPTTTWSPSPSPTTTSSTTSTSSSHATTTTATAITTTKSLPSGTYTGTDTGELAIPTSVPSASQSQSGTSVLNQLDDVLISCGELLEAAKNS